MAGHKSFAELRQKLSENSNITFANVELEMDDILEPIDESKKVTVDQVRKIMGPTKSAKQAVQVVGKKLGLSPKEAQSWVQKVLEDDLREETELEEGLAGSKCTHCKGKGSHGTTTDFDGRKVDLVCKYCDGTGKSRVGVKKMGRVQGKLGKGQRAGVREAKDNDKPPFDPPYHKTRKYKDRYGNTVKDKNIAKHLAKKGMRTQVKKVSESKICE